jgi:hypothetical protein
VRRWFLAVAFFVAVPPLSHLMVASFVAITAAAAIATSVDADRARAALVPTLVLQVFATSTGFATHARRGHYDLLLTTGVGRLRTAAVQWMMAASPGALSWALIAGVEVMATDTAYGLTSGTITALVTVSTVPWAITVALPRFSGAIGWLLVVVATLALASPGARVVLLEGAETAPLWLIACAGPLFPMRMVGIDAAHEALAVVPALVLAALSMMTALVWIHRTPLPLEAGQ